MKDFTVYGLSGFRHFNSSAMKLPITSLPNDHFRFWATDGSSFTFFQYSEIFIIRILLCPGHSANDVYSMHLNAFYDLDSHIYTDALIQPVHCKNEFGAFRDIVDRHSILAGRKNVYIGDRRYCSYNNMAHVVEQGQLIYILFKKAVTWQE